MITSFHTLCIIAHYVYVVLREALSSRFKTYVIKDKDSLTFKGGKYLISSECYFAEGYGPKFVPQLFVQRYLTVKAALEDEEWKGSIRKIVEFGCADFGFFLYLKRLAGVQEVLEVDVDNNVLVQNYCKVSPLNSDYLFQRSEPLTVIVLEGNIAYTDEWLEGCDAVVCIELIEHLYPDVLEEVPYTVFGCIKPQVAIFTTPNVEFNVLFPNSKGFRHPDHKFEWTRAQFKSWADNIVLRYPDYEVSLHGIGWGPHGTENVGACSQMAVFQKHSPSKNGESTIEDVRIHNPEHKYRLLRKHEYPFHVDTRSQKQKILDQLEYSIRMLSTSDEFMEGSQILIPVFRLLPFVREWITSEKELQDLLREAGWNIQDQQSGNLVIVFPEYESSVTEEEPVECDTYEVICSEPHRVENWDDYVLDASSEKWDCDSLDQNIESGATWNDSWSEKNESSCTCSSEKGNDDYREGSVPSTSGQMCVNKAVLKNEDGCPSSTSVNAKRFIDEETTDFELPYDVDIDCEHVHMNDHSSAQIIEKVKNSLPFFIATDESIKKKSDEVENCDQQTLSRSNIANTSSSFVSNNITQPHLTSLDSSQRTTNNIFAESYHHTDVPLRFLKSTSPSSNLYLNLQTEAQGTNTETNKKQEGFTDSPAAGSISLEEPNDRLADSGYPNSTSAQDMDLDLTPEQVDELFTENDVVTDHPHDHHSDSVSVSSRDSDSVNEPQPLPQPPPMVMPQPDVLFEEAMNVENGDVANNNRDGEGNNVVAVRALLNEGGNDVGDDNAVAMAIGLPENLDDLIPLFAAAEDIDNDNEVEINVVEPFPPWLLNMLGLANGGAMGGGGGDEEEPNDHGHESSEDEDSENNPVIDEGLGDEFNLDSSSLSDTCPSDLGPESEVGGEVAVANS